MRSLFVEGRSSGRGLDEIRHTSLHGQRTKSPTLYTEKINLSLVSSFALSFKMPNRFRDEDLTGRLTRGGMAVDRRREQQEQATMDSDAGTSEGAYAAMRGLSKCSPVCACNAVNRSKIDIWGIKRYT